jgi:hypothetical protein
VVVVNLDNHCELEDFEEDGIFIRSGDIIIVTGRERGVATTGG